MNFQQAKNLIDKINGMFSIMQEDNVSSIEKELMRKYISNLYELFIDLPNDSNIVKPNTIAKPIDKPIQTPPVATSKINTPPINPSAPKFVIKETPKVEPPVEQAVPEVKITEPTPVVVKETPIVPPVVEPIVEKPVITQTPASTNKKYALLFEQEVATDISHKLSQSPVNNLMQAMGINERFLFINELFGENADSFKNAVDKLDNLPNFTSAKIYIEGELAAKYNWLEEDKLNRAKDFIKLVRRRYN